MQVTAGASNWNPARIRAMASHSFRRLVPEAIQAWLDCRRAVPAWRRGGVIFVHTPKAAGSSISTALYGKSLGHIYASDIARFAGSEFARLPSFSIVREPFARYLSAVRYLQSNFDTIRGAPGLPPDLSMLNDPERVFHEWLAHADVNHVNYIFRPQHLYLCSSEGTILPRFVGQFEELDRAMEEVSSWIGRKIELPVVNASRASSSKAVPGSLREEVRRFYARDVETFLY